MKNVALYNLGCKVNSYEVEVMRQNFQEKGYRIVPFDETADIYVVNTCTVTNIADRKSRQMLHRAKQMNPEAIVVAAGCYVQTGRGAVEKDDSIDLAVGNKHKKDIVEIVERYMEERTGQADGRKADGTKTLPYTILSGSGPKGGCPRDEYEDMRLRGTAEHTRAYIKIQDGCNQFCSYCVIPYARGRVRSRRAEDVLQEIRGMAEAGYREVVLTGIHISSYGTDFPDAVRNAGAAGGNWSALVELVEQIHQIQGLSRIRLGSLEPRLITPRTASRLAALPKLCPHFHLSLQSGCDATLKRMNRHYTTGEYYKSVEDLRECFGRPAITTDVIVGFPGETEEEFGRTREFLEKVGFYEMHIFKYSRRTGTVAAGMPQQVPEQVKALRSSELLEMEKRQSLEFRRGYIGREAEVLLEETREIGGRIFHIGHTRDYVKVALGADSLPGKARAANLLVKIQVSGFLTDEILM